MTGAPCTVPGCHRDQVARGLCMRHYKQTRRGTPIKATLPDAYVAALDGWVAEGRAAAARGLCMPHYKQQRRGQALPTGAEPRVGDRDGFGRYGVLDRDKDGVTCHECGRRFAGLCQHAVMAHGMTAAEYRVAHGLPRGQALTSLAVSGVLSAGAAFLGPGGQRRNVRRGLFRGLLFRGLLFRGLLFFIRHYFLLVLVNKCVTYVHPINRISTYIHTLHRQLARPDQIH